MEFGSALIPQLPFPASPCQDSPDIPSELRHSLAARNHSRSHHHTRRNKVHSKADNSLPVAFHTSCRNTARNCRHTASCSNPSDKDKVAETSPPTPAATQIESRAENHADPDPHRDDAHLIDARLIHAHLTDARQSNAHPLDATDKLAAHRSAGHHLLATAVPKLAPAQTW